MLPPEASGAVLSGFQRAAPSWRLEGAQIDRDVVRGTACVASGACFPFELVHPERCKGHRAGPWCLRFPAQSPLPADVASLVRALAADADASLWKNPSARSSSPESRVALLALLTVLVPSLFGLGLGLLLRRRLGARRHAATTALALGAAPLLLVPFAPIGLWDLALIGLLAGGGCVLAARGLSREAAFRAALVCVSLLAGFVLVEVWQRVAPRTNVATPVPLRDLEFFLDERMLSDNRCGLLHSPERLALRVNANVAPEKPRIVHLGDSMIEGADVRAHEDAASRLGALDDRFVHLNFGARWTGTDFHLLIARRVLEQVQPRQVVLHAFGGNDLGDLNGPYPCCPGGPLLVEDDPLLPARCPSRAWQSSPLTAVFESPPPLALRALATESRAAALLWAGLSAFQLRLGGALPDPRDTPAKLAYFARVVGQLSRELAAQGIPLVVSVLPERSVLERAAANPEDPKVGEALAVYAAMREAAAGPGVTVLDPWPLFEEAVRTRSANSIFLGEPVGNVHFNPDGHELYARWLHSQLAASWEPAAGEGEPVAGGEE